MGIKNKGHSHGSIYLCRAANRMALGLGHYVTGPLVIMDPDPEEGM